MHNWDELYATYLDKKGEPYLYEHQAFPLILNNKQTTYTPDFFLLNKNLYIEIKGYWRGDAKEKFELFLKIYPEIKIELLMENDLKKLGINLKRRKDNETKCR